MNPRQFCSASSLAGGAEGGMVRSSRDRNSMGIAKNSGGIFRDMEIAINASCSTLTTFRRNLNVH